MDGLKADAEIRLDRTLGTYSILQAFTWNTSASIEACNPFDY